MSFYFIFNMINLLLSRSLRSLPICVSFRVLFKRSSSLSTFIQFNLKTFFSVFKVVFPDCLYHLFFSSFSSSVRSSALYSPSFSYISSLLYFCLLSFLKFSRRRRYILTHYFWFPIGGAVVSRLFPGGSAQQLGVLSGLK